MARSRSGLLAGQWRQDRGRALTPRHLFEADARTEVAPAALCGDMPRSVPEATSLRLIGATYAQSIDCAPCRQAIGENVA